ncbi:MAG: hypothetical protein B6D64_08980 [Bacteroidetes bacterium 4484_276]|nr:MAG: hypothetical protein B6D64_08980 [Bacteroidetes bacterium 4484_276]OYT12989.1 MAG: hypothetical protein B6I19_07440 [Bacteroidetes bacterium 4572_114]
MEAIKTNFKYVLCLWLLFMGFFGFNQTFAQLPLLSQAEYFYDTDPGYGNGINIPVESNSIIDVTFEMDVSGLSTGFHKAYFRTKDENNVWGLTNVIDIYVGENQQNPQPLPEIIHAEYFLDTDPGEGNGNSIPVAGGTVIDTDFEIGLAGVSPGFHKAYFRTKDENNVWSLTNVMVIYVVVNYQTLHINIPAGWSGISSFVVPDDPSVETIFEPVVDEIVILQNFDGMYWPFAGVNTIGNWDDMDGYQIKMETAQQVTFTGTIQDNLVANLTEGWNYLPVLNPCDNITVDLFSQITGNLQIVKEVAGYNVYWPEFGVSTLDEIIPGKAYFVLVDDDVVVEFPECSFKSSALSGQVGNQTLTGFQTLSGLNLPKTPITHIIAIPGEAISGLSDGDIIGVFGPSGHCYGAISIALENLALTVFGDDPTTPQIDGMTESEYMQFRVCNPETGKEYPLNVEFDGKMPQGGYFVHHGLSAVKSIQATGIKEFEENPILISVYPNPSSGIFNIQLMNTTDIVGWEIVNIHGSTIIKGFDQVNGIIIDLSSHPKGIYYLKITHEETQVVEKLMLQ